MSELKIAEVEEFYAVRKNLKRMSTYDCKFYFSSICLNESIAREHYRRARKGEKERDQAEVSYMRMRELDEIDHDQFYEVDDSSPEIIVAEKVVAEAKENYNREIELEKSIAVNKRKAGKKLEKAEMNYKTLSDLKHCAGYNVHKAETELERAKEVLWRFQWGD